MKRLVLTLAVVLVSTWAFAHPKNKKENEAVNAQYTVYHDQSFGSVNLVYKTFSTRPVMVYIYDDQRRLVFTDRIKESGVLIRPYNFKELKPGKYTFKIVENRRTITSDVVYAPTATVSAIKANIGQCGENKYKLSVIGDQMKPVNVRIYDRYNDLIFSETINEPAAFSKVYNLEKMNGACRFEVMAGNERILEKKF